MCDVKDVIDLFKNLVQITAIHYTDSTQHIIQRTKYKEENITEYNKTQSNKNISNRIQHMAAYQ